MKSRIATTSAVQSLRGLPSLLTLPFQSELQFVVLRRLSLPMIVCLNIVPGTSTRRMDVVSLSSVARETPTSSKPHKLTPHRRMWSEGGSSPHDARTRLILCISCTIMSAGSMPNPPRCVCSICGKTFARQAHLDRHQDTHIARMRWSCAFCENSYTRRYAIPTVSIVHIIRDSYSSKLGTL
jgi:hypothetical protein